MTQFSPRQALQRLREGNHRFCEGHPQRPHQDSSRLRQAGNEDQSAHAFATIITCSDSRVPVELIFDAGVMDLFVIQVAGNVVRVGQAGSIEYGLIHVGTPLLVVLGHSQCGAVTAALGQAQGGAPVLERNIGPLLQPIMPAVDRALLKHLGASPEELVARAVEENVWQAVHDLFMLSPAVRRLVRARERLVRGAIYDVASGGIAWLPAQQVRQVLDQVSSDPQRPRQAWA